MLHLEGTWFESRFFFSSHTRAEPFLPPGSPAGWGYDSPSTTPRSHPLAVVLLKFPKAASQLDLMWRKWVFKGYRQRCLCRLGTMGGTGVLPPAPCALVLWKELEGKRRSCTALVELWNNTSFAVWGLGETAHKSLYFLRCTRSRWRQFPLSSRRAELGPFEGAETFL